MICSRLVLLVTIWGVIAYQRIPKDIYPDLNAPLVTIITENPGMASEDVGMADPRALEQVVAAALPSRQS